MKEWKRLSVLVKALFALVFLSALIGGISYYTSARNAVSDQLHHDADRLVMDIMARIEASAGELQGATRALSGLSEIRRAVSAPAAGAVPAANSILDLFKDSLKTDVCYLLDRSGRTIATSNRNSPSSFLGKDYAFRPYFRESIAGNPFIYFALGMTSGTRGIYYSHPVYAGNNRRPVGVAVIKLSVKGLEMSFQSAREGQMALVSPEGMVFLSNQPDWPLRFLWEAAPDAVQAVTAGSQFGAGPWEWLGFKRIDNSTAIDASKKRYRVHERAIALVPGWRLIYLHDPELMARRMSGPLLTLSGYFIMALFLLISGAGVVFLRWARRDITERKEQERLREELIEKLQKALAEIKTLKGFIPICSTCKKIRNDKGFWDTIEKHLIEHSDAEFTYGICPECEKKTMNEFQKLMRDMKSPEEK